MIPCRQNASFTPVSVPQSTYLAIEQQPTDETEAQRLEQLQQLIQAAPDVADLRDFASQARELLGEGYAVHSGSAHVWLKRNDQTDRLAIIADRYTTHYRDWNAQTSVPAEDLPEYSI